MPTKFKLNKIQKDTLKENVECFDFIETKLSRIHSNFLIPDFDGHFLKTALETEKIMLDIRNAKDFLNVFIKEYE
jgi:hypothetical protein